MKDKEKKIIENQIQKTTALTLEDFKKFMEEKSDKKRWKILLAHAKKNNKMLKQKEKRKI